MKNIKKKIGSSKIKLSILCLTFNHEKFIRDALDGFLNQNVDFNIEIVIHDDKSTDGTRFIIDEYSKNFPEIIKKVYPDKNILSSGGNVLKNAIEACAGDYIAFCEGDDQWVDENKIQEQVNFLDSNKDCVLVYSNCQPFNEFGPLNIELHGLTKNATSHDLIGSPSIYTLTTCFRNIITIPPEAALARYGDLFLWTLLGHHGSGEYIHSNKPPKYRIHSGGMNSTKSLELRFEMIIATYSAIMTYYRRIGDGVCAKRFRWLIISSVIKYIIVKIPLLRAAKNLCRKLLS